MTDVIINNLQNVIIYIVIGYLFCSTYHFVALKQNNQDIEHVLISSLVIGYIIWNIARLIPINISFEIDVICICFTSILLAYICGRISTSYFKIDILRKLNIHDTGNVYMWDDLMDNYLMKVNISYDDGILYEGFIYNFESYSNTPHMVLAKYKMFKNKECLKDYSDRSDTVIVLDTSNAKYIEVIYNSNSPICNDIKEINTTKITKEQEN